MSKEIIITEEDAAFIIKKDGTIEVFIGRALTPEMNETVKMIIDRIKIPNYETKTIGLSQLVKPLQQTIH